MTTDQDSTPGPELERALMAGGLAAGPGARIRSHLRRAGPRYVSVLLLPVIVLLWQWVTAAELMHTILLPEFTSVVAAFVRLVTGAVFLQHLSRTVTEILAGFSLGAAIGVLLGLLLSSFPLLRRAYFPLLATVEALPIVVVAPIIIIWLGFGISSKVATATVASIFPVFVTTLAGLSLVSDNELKLMRSLRASRWQIFRKLRLPTALPAIFGGLKIAMATSTIAAIVAEFVGADAGLGYLTLQYKSNFDISGMFALIFVFMIIGSGGFLLIEAVERKAVFWRKQ